MRMRKNLTPMDFNDHTEIAKWIYDFVENFDKNIQLLKKGFLPTHQVIKKLQSMYEIGYMLKYSLQQGADLHKSKLEETSGKFDPEFAKKWSKLYLGDK